VVTGDSVFLRPDDGKDFFYCLGQLVIDHQIVIMADVFDLVPGDAEAFIDLLHRIRSAFYQALAQDLHGRRDDKDLDIGDIRGADLSSTLDVYIHYHVAGKIQPALDIADRGAVPISKDSGMLQKVLLIYPFHKFRFIHKVVVDAVLFLTSGSAGREGYRIIDILRHLQYLCEDSAFSATGRGGQDDQEAFAFLDQTGLNPR